MADTKVSMRRKWAKEVINVGRFCRVEEELTSEIWLLSLQGCFDVLVETYCDYAGQSESAQYGSRPGVQGYGQANVHGVIGHVGTRRGHESIVNA